MNLILSATAGLILGLLYFMLLWLTVRQALGHPRWATMFGVSRLARLVLFALVFVAAAHGSIAQGMVLLAGFWAGRWYVLARMGGVGYGR